MNRRYLPIAAVVLGLAAPAAAQQQSPSYKFLQAVKDTKGDVVTEMLNAPGSRIIDARDVDNGEGALHIVVRRGDMTYLRFLLQKGADANMRDDKGVTPLMLAVTAGQNDMIPVLIAGGANPNLGNAAGETPLIRAVQRRDVPTVRELLTAGADPDQTDNLAGLSARDYANRDTRNPVIAKIIADTPKRKRAAVAGPKY